MKINDVPLFEHDPTDPINVIAEAKAGIRALLRLMGEDPDRDGLKDTPRRVLSSMIEMTARPGNVAELLGVVFDESEAAEQMISVGPIPFSSLCEHHLLPFSGNAWLAYVPKMGRIVGLSKLSRVVEHYARRLQVQERLTSQITEAIMTHLSAQGAACLIRSQHACMTLRGIRKAGAMMTTTDLRGCFLDNATTRAEFMAGTR